MNPEYRHILAKLVASGWRVDTLAAPESLPEAIASRYPWIPRSHQEFIKETRRATSPDEKAWLLTAADFALTSDAAYAWNEWERQSLEAADTDEQWKRDIRAFWDDHFPVLLSVRSGYAYFALERGNLRVVRGGEPEFEETTPVASSVGEFLELLVARDPEVARWT